VSFVNEPPLLVAIRDRLWSRTLQRFLESKIPLPPSVAAIGPVGVASPGARRDASNVLNSNGMRIAECKRNRLRALFDANQSGRFDRDHNQSICATVGQRTHRFRDRTV
jgi:hypothetical protein